MISRAFRQLAVLLALALVPAVIAGAIQLKYRKPEALREGEIPLDVALGWGDQVLWVDARSRARFERDHIPGAVLLNEDEWVRLVGPFLEAWQPDKTIVVYCDSGSCDASHEVAQRIKEEIQLESTVWVLQGGWSAWQRRK